MPGTDEAAPPEKARLLFPERNAHVGLCGAHGRGDHACLQAAGRQEPQVRRAERHWSGERRSGHFRVFPPAEQTAKWTRQRWPTDIRLVNVGQMLDSSLPVLVPIKALVCMQSLVD